MLWVDVPLVVLGFLYLYVEVRRGFFCSFTDFCGMMLGLRVFYSAWPWLTKWFYGLGLSKQAAFVLGSLTSFLPIVILMITAGWVVHNMTLISLGDVFEQILATVAALSAFLVLARFGLIVLGGLGNKAIQEAILNSLIGRELYTLETVRYFLQKLEPLTNPGEIYI